jgi:hypothetical protein
MYPHFKRINRQTPVKKKTVLSDWKGLFRPQNLIGLSNLTLQQIATAKDPPGNGLPLAPETTFRLAIQPSIQCPCIQTLLIFFVLVHSSRSPSQPFIYLFLQQINVKLRRLWKIRISVLI